jgi:hypothetical protein
VGESLSDGNLSRPPWSSPQGWVTTVTNTSNVPNTSNIILLPAPAASGSWTKSGLCPCGSELPSNRARMAWAGSSPRLTVIMVMTAIRAVRLPLGADLLCRALSPARFGRGWPRRQPALPHPSAGSHYNHHHRQHRHRHRQRHLLPSPLGRKAGLGVGVDVDVVHGNGPPTAFRPHERWRPPQCSDPVSRPLRPCTPRPQFPI